MKKISIYQVLPRLFGNANTTRLHAGSYETNGCGKMEAFTPQALEAIKDLGCTHIWYTGVIEHATRTSFVHEGIAPDHEMIVKGEAGSPYSIKDYYDIAPSLAMNVRERMQEFDALVRRTHEVGMGVIVDLVPNHVSRQYFSDSKPAYIQDFGAKDDCSAAFSPRNNFYYLPMETLKLEYGKPSEPMPYMEFPAKATGNDCFSATPSSTDWYETVKLNYGVDYLGGHTTHFDPIPDTWTKMFDIVEYWIHKGVDGFRCDMAQMVPIEFWRELIGRCRKISPKILFIAEIYTPERYEEYIDAGFDYLYDKVGLYDTLVSVLKGDAPASAITRTWQAQQKVRDHLLHFMENHDEPRLASDFVIGEGRKAFPAMVVSTLIDKGAVMTYFAQELGERGMDEEGYSGLDGRTSIFDYWSIDSIQRWIGAGNTYTGEELSEQEKELRSKYRSLLHFALRKAALSQGDFFDLMYVNSHPPTDSSREYYFLRACGAEVALVAVNFGDNPIRRSILLPEHAFATLGIRNDTPCVVEDLFRRRKGVALLSSDKPYEVEVDAHDAAIYYFCATS